MNTRLRFSISLLIKPMAEMLVAKGQGLIAVISPNMNAVIKEYWEFSRMLRKNSIKYNLKMR